jgi:uncharacterized protein with gpF-like domain
MPDLPTNVFNALYEYIMQQQAFTSTARLTSKTLSSTEANLFNYTIVKTYKLMNNLKKIEVTANMYDIAKDTINTMFNSNQATEDYQVSKITTMASTISVAKNLEFVTRKDIHVREEHKKMDGLVAPADSPIWTNTLKLLSDWNCRCQIVVSQSKTKILPSQISNVKSITKAPSTINLADEKVLVFNQHLDMFNVPSTIKRQLRKNGF